MDCSKYLRKLNLFKHNYVGYDKEKNKLWCLYGGDNGTTLAFFNDKSNELKINDDIIISKDLFINYCGWNWLYDIYLNGNILIFVNSDKLNLDNNYRIDKEYYFNLILNHLVSYLELNYFNSYNKSDNFINGVSSKEYLKDKFKKLIIVD